MKNKKYNSGELIEKLKQGNVLIKTYPYEDINYAEYLFFECNSIGIRGWGSSLGNSEDRINDIILHPENWNVVENFNISQGYPFPWSCKYK